MLNRIPRFDQHHHVLSNRAWPCVLFDRRTSQGPVRIHLPFYGEGHLPILIDILEHYDDPRLAFMSDCYVHRLTISKWSSLRDQYQPQVDGSLSHSHIEIKLMTTSPMKRSRVGQSSMLFTNRIPIWRFRLLQVHDLWDIGHQIIINLSPSSTVLGHGAGSDLGL